MKRLWLLMPALVVGLIGKWGFEYWREHRFDTQIATAAKLYGAPPALVKAVVWRESRFNPAAKGLAGEFGLMQIRSVAANEWAKAQKVQNFEHAHCLHPGTNTMAATWYLKKLLDRYSQTDNPVPYALADFNAGRSNVLRWKIGSATTNSEAFIQQIGFPGTKRYVQAVMKRSERYKSDFE